MAKHLKAGVVPPPPGGQGGAFPMNVDLKLVDYYEETENSKGEKLAYPRGVFVLEDRQGTKYRGSSSAFYCSYVSENGTFEYDAEHYTDSRLDDWFQYRPDQNTMVRQIVGKAIELTPEKNENSLDRSRYLQLAANGKWYPYTRKARTRIHKVEATTNA
jgi:hypothetical protein